MKNKWKNLQPLNGLHIQGGSLIFDSVRSEDEGRYRCIAFNTAGNDTAVTTLTVRSK